MYVYAYKLFVIITIIFDDYLTLIVHPSLLATHRADDF